MFQNPLAEIADNIISTSGVSRIPFVDLCAYHAALVCQTPTPVVAYVSKLTPGAIYYLRHAGQHKGGQIRYPRVARERAALGDEAFIHKYLTPAIRDQLLAAGRLYKQSKLEPRQARAINPRADSLAGRHILKTPVGDEEITIEFLRAPADKAGWYWRHRDSGALMRGDPRNQERPFPNSRAAYLFCKLRLVEMDEAANDDRYFWEQNP